MILELSIVVLWIFVRDKKALKLWKKERRMHPKEFQKFGNHFELFSNANDNWSKSLKLNVLEKDLVLKTHTSFYELHELHEFRMIFRLFVEGLREPQHKVPLSQ